MSRGCSSVAPILRAVRRPAPAILNTTEHHRTPGAPPAAGWQARSMIDDLADDKVLAADHETPEHVTQDSPLVCGQRVHEDHNLNLRGPARTRDLVCLARADQRPPRKRLGHPGRTTARDTPPLNMPTHHPSTMDTHQSRQHIKLRDELLVVRREQAHEQHISASQHATHGARHPTDISCVLRPRATSKARATAAAAPMSAASVTAVAPEPPRVADREWGHRAADNDGRCRAVLGWQRSRSLDAIIRMRGSHWARHGFVVCLMPRPQTTAVPAVRAINTLARVTQARSSTRANSLHECGNSSALTP
jgi:hypothetical protein